MEQISKNLADKQVEAKRAVAQQDTMKNTGAVVRHAGVKIAGEEILLNKAATLPQTFSRPFSYLSANQPLTAILGEVGRRTGLNVALQPSDPTVQRPQVQSVPGMPQTGTPSADTPIAVDWSGDLKGLLDYLASATQMYWKFEDNRVYFFKSDTRVFHVFLPGGKRTIKSSISLANTSSGSSSSSGSSGSSGGGSSGSGSSGGTVDVASTLDVDAYDAIVKSVQAIVSAAEGRQPAVTQGAAPQGVGGQVASTRNVVANPSLGIVTVTATPEILDRVGSYIRSLNERFAQNVMINVKVYNLTVRQGVDLGASLQLAYRNAAEHVGVNAGSAISSSGLSNGQMVLSYLGGNFNGSSILLRALKTLGDVQDVSSGQVIAANGQPSPLQVANEFTYVSSSSTTVAANGLAVTSLTADTRKVGFTANFLPLVLGDNRILLQYQINLSALLSLDTIQSGSGLIQTPNIATQSLQQQAFVRDGESIVLLGFEQDRTSQTRTSGISGIGDNSSSTRNVMVIVMEVYGGK